MKKALALAVVAGLATMASAQSATITTTANGGAAAVVAPGSTVQINAVVSWTGAVQLAGLKGAVTVAGNAGAGGNFTSEFTAGSLVNLGAFTGGSRTGLDIGVTPAFFTGGFIVPPTGNSAGISFAKYDLNLTGVAAGTYAVGFTPDATAPNVRLYVTTATPGFVEAQTSLVGATITITPAPASLALVGLGGLVAGRRRR
jgi:uncharacterized protein (TIGR03382 family)